jgi:3-hydroxyisobutyrate dehydrogenase
VRRVGFVGLGQMGLPMAVRLVHAGLEVVGYDVRSERTDLLATSGGQAAASASEAANESDALVLIPFNAQQLEQALLGDDGALRTLPAGSLVVAMATVGPRAIRAIANKVQEVGDYAFVDAPVTGGTARAAAGDLTAIAGGVPHALERAQSVLQPMCSKIFRVGDEPGAGQTIKLINQLMVGVHLAATAEAFAIASAAGVDVRQLYDVLTSGFARSEMLVSRAAAVLDGSLKTGGALRIFLKDLPLVLELGRELQVPLFAGGAAFNLVELAAELGCGQEDDAALVALLMELAARDKA